MRAGTSIAMMRSPRSSTVSRSGVSPGRRWNFGKRNRSLSAGTAHQNVGVQGGQRHRQVGRMRRDAVVGPSEDGMIAIEPKTRRTARARPSLVAGEIILIAEVCAASSLHDVPANGGHISELARCGEQETFCNYRETRAYVRVRRNITHPRQGAYAQPTVRQRFDLRTDPATG